MKKKIFFMMLISLLLCINSGVFAYTAINSNTMLERSTLDDLKINIKDLPQVTWTGSTPAKVVYPTANPNDVGIDESLIALEITADDYKTLDLNVTAFFENCGTIGNKNIDMKIVYSDIVTGTREDVTHQTWDPNKTYLYWSNYGTIDGMNSDNEWFYLRMQHCKVDIYFYYHGETTPINLDCAYLSIFSEDKDEGSSTLEGSNVYLYNPTNMAYEESKTLASTGRTYSNLYYGTGSGSTGAGYKNCVSFQYKNRDHINVELYSLIDHGAGYHFRYIPLTANVPTSPVKSVNKTEAKLGDSVTYTVEQKISKKYDTGFYYSSLVFTDTLDENLTYDSFSVYNEAGNDVTASAGSTSYDSTTGKITYTFNQEYLKNMEYNDQTYKFVVNATISKKSTSAIISNKSEVNINNTTTLESNTVTTTLKSSVIVHYVDKNTGKKISEDTLIQGNYLTTYQTTAKDIDSYTLVGDSGKTSGVMQSNETEVTYYYKKNSAGVVTKYIDQVTKEEIAASKSQTGLENDEYTTIEEVVPGYELVLTPANATGKMTPELTTVTYEYRKQSNVTVKYVDENTGKELLGQVTTTYKQGDPYTTEKKDISGYTYTKDTGNVAGTVERENIEVVYYYKRNTKVVVKYIDEVTKEEIIDSVEITGLEKDPYETEEKEKAGYELVGVEGNTTGKMTVDPIEVTYKYRKNANLITKHIDKNSGEKIVEDVVKKYKEGDKYEALPQNIAGYVLVESPEETTGTMGREDVEKTFYYKKISGGLVVKYVDKITNELLDIEEYTGNENDLITFDEKTFLHYVIYSRPDVSESRLTPEAQEYTYYYLREAKVNVRGIDQDTKEVLYETTMSGLEGNEYTTEPRKVDGYELVKIPQNKDGVYSRNTQDVVYEYKKISLGVTVKYLDKETGKEIADEERITGYVGDTYQTEKKEIEDYNFVEVKGDAIGSLDAEEKEVIYYYEKKTGKVEVIYEDREGNVLLKEEMKGKVKEKYKVEEKEIKNYKIVERPEQTEGEYKEGTIILKYILEKKQGRITVNFVDKEGNKLAESIITEGYVEESYELEAPEIEGYKVIKNGQIKTEYTEEEQIIDVVYEKVEISEIPATGDMPVNIFIIVFGISLLGLTIHLKKCKQ